MSLLKAHAPFPQGPKLMPSGAVAAAVEKILALHAEVPLDDYTHGHLLRSNAGFRMAAPRVLEATLPLLREMAKDEQLEASVRTAAERKARTASA